MNFYLVWVQSTRDLGYIVLWVLWHKTGLFFFNCSGLWSITCSWQNNFSCCMFTSCFRMILSLYTNKNYFLFLCKYTIETFWHIRSAARCSIIWAMRPKIQDSRSVYSDGHSHHDGEGALFRTTYFASYRR